MTVFAFHSKEGFVFYDFIVVILLCFYLFEIQSLLMDLLFLIFFQDRFIDLATLLLSVKLLGVLEIELFSDLLISSLEIRSSVEPLNGSVTLSGAVSIFNAFRYPVLVNQDSVSYLNTSPFGSI